MNNCGIDLGKKSSAYCICTPAGKILERGTFKMYTFVGAHG